MLVFKLIYDVFRREDLGSGPYTPSMINVPYIIAALYLK